MLPILIRTHQQNIPHSGQSRRPICRIFPTLTNRITSSRSCRLHSLSASAFARSSATVRNCPAPT
eukprot:17830-Prorocentrum_minimum.AAC.1